MYARPDCDPFCEHFVSSLDAFFNSPWVCLQMCVGLSLYLVSISRFCALFDWLSAQKCTELTHHTV